MAGLQRLCVTGGLAALLIVGLARPAQAGPVKTFTAVLNGGQEVPANTSLAFGVGFFTFDRRTKLLCYSITFSAALDGETAAHFHGPARPGESADILFPITPVPSRAKTGCVGPIVDGRLRRALLRGLFYVNVHSASLPAGEIRGQVLPATLP
jgi:hypothetical protein